MGYRVKAVIFDQDGLMFDTERLSAEAWSQVGKKYGIAPGDDFFDALKGGNPQQTKELMKRAFGEDFDCDGFLKEKRAYNYQLIARRGVPVKPGLKELLAYLKDHGCPAAVATSSSEEWTQRNVREAGVDSYFDLYTYGSMVERSKPEPEIFLLTASRLGVRPQECMVLEDSFNGVEAGMRGGFLTVMVPDTSLPGEALKARLTACCQSLKDVIGLFEEGFFTFAGRGEENGR